MNEQNLKSFADLAISYGKKLGGTSYEQYEHAKEYLHVTKGLFMREDEYVFIVKQLASAFKV